MTTRNWMYRDFKNKGDLIAAMEEAMRPPIHPSSSHTFVPDDKHLGNSCCLICGWVNPGGPVVHEGKTMYQWVQQDLEALKGPNGEAKFKELMENRIPNRRKILLTVVRIFKF